MECISIGDVRVAMELFTEPFACNVVECKGACCTIPGCYGAPLDDEELPMIEQALPYVLPLLSPQSQAVIAQHGFAERAPNGQWVTMTLDGRECVFAIVEQGIASCAFHRAYQAGWIGFIKPLSCHLFPVRQREQGRLLIYERYSECAPAVQQGKRIGSTVYSSVRAALRRAYGDRWLAAADTAVECLSLDRRSYANAES
ncbi:MAG: DUF3109 family protein [Bacteroidota bacterium]|nr:DUF3109 family protein [Candidatus Kapabacteria bacterium]MCS7302918.1 DUF3109 family protein [Candidatus Kapabacteria bacterium]MCX7937423.1 DUF3109 family protein [Chlorobiota bacterium]MDW8075783.1 DUF3109 family protein [Bacteroidota bacterium]MDW8272462.1 DUF3109 family protein [Bacteroidota bacterium]